MITQEKNQTKSKVEKLKDRLKAAKKEEAKIKRAAAKKAAEKEVQNQDRMDKAIGKFVREQMKKNGTGAEILKLNGVAFSDWLVSQEDRILFGLKPLELAKEGNENGNRS